MLVKHLGQDHDLKFSEEECQTINQTVPGKFFLGRVPLDTFIESFRRDRLDVLFQSMMKPDVPTCPKSHKLKITRVGDCKCSICSKDCPEGTTIQMYECKTCKYTICGQCLHRKDEFEIFEEFLKLLKDMGWTTDMIVPNLKYIWYTKCRLPWDEVRVHRLFGEISTAMEEEEVLAKCWVQKHNTDGPYEYNTITGDRRAVTQTTSELTDAGLMASAVIAAPENESTSTVPL